MAAAGVVAAEAAGVVVVAGVTAEEAGLAAAAWRVVKKKLFRSLPIFSADRKSDSHYPFSERLTFRVIAIAAQHGPEQYTEELEVHLEAQHCPKQYTEVLEEDITNESLKEEARWW